MLYHKEVYLPQFLKNLDTIVFEPIYSPHAIEEAESDIYGGITLPKYVKFNGNSIIEAELGCQNEVKKLVVRVAYNSCLDMVVVFIPENQIVKTVWFNERRDKHRTLDRSKYCHR